MHPSIYLSVCLSVYPREKIILYVYTYALVNSQGGLRSRLQSSLLPEDLLAPARSGPRELAITSWKADAPMETSADIITRPHQH